MRFIWVFPLRICRAAIPAVPQSDPGTTLAVSFHHFVYGTTRSGCALAAALSIPLVIAIDQPFPERSLILFLTFSVIVVTLVLQGPTLPWLVRALGLVNSGSEERQQHLELEAQARVAAARAAFDRLQQLSTTQEITSDQARQLSALQLERVNQLERRRDRDGVGGVVAARLDRIELTLVQAEREHINSLLRKGCSR